MEQHESVFSALHTVIRDALLYTLTEENILHYNVVCRAVLSPEVKVWGCEAADADSLRAILGTPDVPELIFSTRPGSRTLGRAVTANLALDDRGTVISVHITRIACRPTVGISWKRDALASLYPQFAEILERNGACAVYLPQVCSDAEADRVLDDIDGILMTGGGDFAPATFGRHQTPHGCQPWDDDRDRSDLAMTRRAVARDIPLLGICRGAQGLNIALGGTLIQDIPLYLGQKVRNGEISADRVTTVLSGRLSEDTEAVPDTGYPRYDGRGAFVPTYDAQTGTYPEDSGCREGHLRVWVDGLRHNKESEGPGYHSLCRGENNEVFVIDPESKWLYPIIGSQTMEFITSTHHQAVDPQGLGSGITVAAFAGDGVVEAIEYKKNLFALGVQWHPERDALAYFHGFPVDQQLCNAPLRALVEYSRIYTQRKR